MFLIICVTVEQEGQIGCGVIVLGADTLWT